MVNLDSLTPQYLTDAAGQKTAVVIPIAQFEDLLEDMEDLASAAERRDEPSVSHAAALGELKRDGLL